MRKPFRILAYLSLSLLIHLGVSEIFEGSAMTRQAPSTVQVSLISRQSPDKPASAELPEPKPRQEPRQKPKPATEPEPMKNPVAETRESEPSVNEPASAQSVGSPAPAEPEPSQRVGTVNSENAANLYRNQVLEIIRKNLKYPGNARKRGIEGTVSVRFTIHGSGSADDIKVVDSSGAALLDKVSLETIRRSSFPPPPEGSMTLNVPITFRLTGEM